MLTRVALTALLLLGLPPALAAQPITIRVDTAFDGKGGTLRNVTLRIDGSRIAPVDADAPRHPRSSRPTVMPGWIEMHVDIAPISAPAAARRTKARRRRRRRLSAPRTCTSR